MAEIELESITAQHGKEYPHIYAYDDKESVPVQDRKWMPRFMSRERPVAETKILYVRVSSCDDVTIQSIKEKIRSNSSRGRR
jgi:hypothetical protein